MTIGEDTAMNDTAVEDCMQQFQWISSQISFSGDTGRVTTAQCCTMRSLRLAVTSKIVEGANGAGRVRVVRTVFQGSQNSTVMAAQNSLR